MRRSRRLQAVLFPVVAAAATLLLAGCFQIGAPAQTQQPTSQPTTDTDTDDSTDDTDTTDDGETVDIFSIGVGDCINDPGVSDTVTETTVVDCGTAHNFEVFANSTVPDGDFPGDDAVTSQADSDCTAAFESYVGLSYDDSVYLLNYFVPTESSWEGGDREILCLISDPSGTNTGTLAGANQ